MFCRIAALFWGKKLLGPCWSFLWLGCVKIWYLLGDQQLWLSQDKLKITIDNCHSLPILLNRVLAHGRHICWYLQPSASRLQICAFLWPAIPQIQLISGTVFFLLLPMTVYFHFLLVNIMQSWVIFIQPSFEPKYIYPKKETSKSSK